MTDLEYIDYSEMMRDARRGLERQREQLEEKVDAMSGYLKILDATDGILAERDRWKEEAEMLREQLQEAGEREAKLEMQLKEMTKLSASVAGKASQDELQKALSTFIRKSKQKRLEKRVAVKEMVLELAIANGITFPTDVAATLDALDDEQTEAKVVNVSGNYNDIDARWSTDGKKIIFASNRSLLKGKNNYDIYIMDAEGGNLTQLTTNGSHDDKPVFAPDGETVFFRSTRGLVWDIWTMKINVGK